MRRTTVAILVLLAAAGAWHARGRTRAVAPAPIDGRVTCPAPPAAPAGSAPLQSPVPGGLAPFRLRPAVLHPLAGFSVDARVLSRHDYDSGREADLSPTDLALGWGRMRDDAVLDRLEISQGGRWYRYRWTGEPPIAPADIVRSSANMHLIPADAATARALSDVRAGDRVRLDGWLVEADAADGWTWRSSLSREDTGDGACEVIYVCALRRL